MDKDNLKIFTNTLLLRILTFVLKGVEFSYSYGRKKDIIIDLFSDIKNIKEEVIKDNIRKLYKNRYIFFDKKTGKLILSSRGKKLIGKLEFNKLISEIKKKEYNGKWTMVFFDIPENKKNLRNNFRKRLKLIGFYEIQKSVFVYPGVCKEEINFIIEYYNLKKYARYAICEEIDNQFHLKKIFNIIR